VAARAVNFTTCRPPRLVSVVMTLANPDYPVRLEVDPPQDLSRLLIFVKWLLLLPQ
jgi:hypothetical protein